MSECVIGRAKAGEKIMLDVGRLCETRMLLEANSGGGKSYGLRVIMEAAHGKVQLIVLDMEGDFASLREKFDFILAGKDGDIPADPRSAEILARKILELGASIIIDLYELKHDQRIQFVKVFCDAMVNAPKELWHPVLVFIDEAHVFCPEHGEAESSSAVVDLITRGRKRGFGTVCATQRLSKFKKDAAAELINKMIGRTGLDIDQKRAGEELGFTKKEDIVGLRDLEPGEFYCFGPALSKHVVLMKFKEAITTHPKAGQREIKAVPRPTERILKDLAKLTDLPAEAQRELKSKEDMMAEIRDLRRQIRMGPKPTIDEKKVNADLDRQARVSYQRGWKEAEAQHEIIAKKMASQIRIYESKLKQIGQVMGAEPLKFMDFEIKIDPRLKPEEAYLVNTRTQQVQPIITPAMIQDAQDPGDVRYGQCEKMILKFLSLESNVDRSFTKQQLGAMTNYSATSGGFKAALSLLRKQELIIQTGDSVQIYRTKVEEARQISQGIRLASLQDWLASLEPSDRKVYQCLYENPRESFTKEDLAEKTGYSPTSGGFKASISHLITLGLAEKKGQAIQFNESISEFLE